MKKNNPHIFYKLLNLFRQNIKYKLFIFILIVISIPVVAFGLISYRLTSSVIQNDYLKYKEQLNTQIIASIDAEINNISRQSIAINSNLDDILYLLNTSREDRNITFLDSKNRAVNYFRSILESNTKINAITLFSLEGEVVLYTDRQAGNLNLNTVEKEAWFKETLSKNGRSILLEPHINKYVNYRLNDNTVISISRAVVDLEDLKPRGILVVDENVSSLSGLFSDISMEPGELFTIFSKSGNNIYSSKQLNDSVYRNLLLQINKTPSASINYKLDKEDMLVSFSESSKYGWKVISLLPKSTLDQKSSFIKNINIMLLIVLIFFSLFISVAFSSFITLPLKKLMKSFRRLQNGDFETSVTVKGSDEFAQIGTTFNTMVSSIKTLIKEKYQSQILRKQAELEVLQGQINPHFLYNTLNSIRAVIEKKDFDNSSRMVENLSDIFRYCLNRGEHTVKVSDEIDHIQRYLFLLKFRFSDRYNVFYDIDNEASNCSIPRLSLQPLVENAIHHGIDPLNDNGEVRIATKVIGDKVYIYISDTGVGIPEEKLNQISESLSVDPEYPHSTSGKGLGIMNVNTRIKLHYGREYGLKISSKPELGTTVKLTLPSNRPVE